MRALKKEQQRKESSFSSKSIQCPEQSKGERYSFPRLGSKQKVKTPGFEDQSKGEYRDRLAQDLNDQMENSRMVKQ